jgi:pimeloyl-ACP methyl ester carboxylesterase
MKVKGDDLMIHLAVWEGEGKDILCVHGITANCRCWDVMASELSPGHRVMAMDLRGRGLSDKPPTGYALAHHLRDMERILEEMGIGRAVIMGHSLGAFITLAFAAEYPERVHRIILVDGGGSLSKEQMDNVFEGIRPALERLGKVFPSRNAYLEAMKQAPYIQPWSSALETYYAYELEVVDEGVRCNIQPQHIEEEAANLREVDVADYYPRVSCQTLILRATEGLLTREDILLPEDVIRRMMREIPDAERMDLDGINHYGIVFQPNEERARKIRAFLEA